MRYSRLDNIQLLRAVAVFSVLFSHVAFELKRMLEEKAIVFNDRIFPGDFGVDLFFIISGFIMIYTCWDKFAENGASSDFVKRRLIRIVPLYWVTTSLMIGIIIAMPDRVHTATSDVWQWVTSYLFIPYAREGDGLIRPVLGLGWSLQYEMIFYAIFAIGLLFSRGLGMLVVIGGVILVYLISVISGSESAVARFLGHQIILEFSLGAILGALYMSGVRISRKVCQISLATGIFLLAISPNFGDMIDGYRLIFYGFPTMLIVAAVVFPDVVSARPVSKPALILGETSYSIYLTHPFVVGAVAMFMGKLGMIEGFGGMQLAFIYTGATLIISLIIGISCHYLFDGPLTNWIKRMVFRKTKAKRVAKTSAQFKKLVYSTS